MQPDTVLILGGTTEASALARRLAGDGRFHPILSFAGRTRAPVLPPIAHRIGGFGGVGGLVAYLRTERVGALIDATHPFAAQMTSHAVDASAQAGVPMLLVHRPPWFPDPGDRWIMVPDMPAATRALGAIPRRVLLTVGQQELAPFAAAPWHDYVIRSVDPPARDALPARATVLTARGPFAEEGERALLTTHRIEIVVTKNSGGSATRAKLHAARRLGLAVVMVERPPIPAVPRVADADAALAWLERHHRSTATLRGV